MTSPTEFTLAQLARFIGTPDAPVIVDVRTPDDLALDPRLVPPSQRRSHLDVATWAPAYAGQKVVVICQRGHKLSQGAAAWLRTAGADASSLEGGFEAWRDAGLPLLAPSRLPKPDASGRTIWVTRARPKIDRIACPWLIRRFIDPSALFLFVSPSEVEGVADRFGGAAFDIENVFWSHREETCTFDTMVHELGLLTPRLKRLARIVRSADTSRLDLEPQAAGLLAFSLGLSRMFKDDLRQLDAAMTLYDALYRWCRDATEETHNWPQASVRA